MENCDFTLYCPYCKQQYSKEAVIKELDRIIEEAEQPFHSVHSKLKCDSCNKIAKFSDHSIKTMRKGPGTKAEEAYSQLDLVPYEEFEESEEINQLKTPNYRVCPWCGLDVGKNRAKAGVSYICSELDLTNDQMTSVVCNHCGERSKYKEKKYQFIDRYHILRKYSIKIVLVYLLFFVISMMLILSGVVFSYFNDYLSNIWFLSWLTDFRIVFLIITGLFFGFGIFSVISKLSKFAIKILGPKGLYLEKIPEAVENKKE